MGAGNMGKRERGRVEGDAYRFLLAFSVLVSAAIARSLLCCRLMNETKMVPLFLMAMASILKCRS